MFRLYRSEKELRTGAVYLYRDQKTLVFANFKAIIFRKKAHATREISAGQEDDAKDESRKSYLFFGVQTSFIYLFN